MPRRSKVPFQNKSHSGWWIFREVEQWVSKRQKTLLPSSRCLVWENTRLLRAKNREEAYRKAMKLGRLGSPSKTEGGEWRFAGISLLLPVYEDIEDGAEILWVDRGLMRVSDIKKLTKTKRRLSVFNDKKEAEH
jgi:ribosomal protein L15E